MRVCGIDPGASGALCVLDSENSAYAAFMDFKGNSIYDICKWLHLQGVSAVWVEDVKSMFGMSARSNFTFGRNLGFAISVGEIACKGTLTRAVMPKVWQKYIGVSVKGKAIKKQVAQIGKSMYPDAILHGPKGGLLDGRSDALMIARYGLNHS
jgi:hypothetical protein